jgi:hypothetical protein
VPPKKQKQKQNPCIMNGSILASASFAVGNTLLGYRKINIVIVNYLENKIEITICLHFLSYSQNDSPRKKS